jgi:hypothetical protein
VSDIRIKQLTDTASTVPYHGNQGAIPLGLAVFKNPPDILGLEDLFGRYIDPGLLWFELDKLTARE